MKTKRMILAGGAAAFLAFSLSACGSDAPDHGVVINHDYIPAHCETNIEYDVALKMPVSHQDCYDDEFDLELRLDKQPGQDPDVGWVEVDQRTFEICRIGEFCDLRSN